MTSTMVAAELLERADVIAALDGMLDDVQLRGQGRLVLLGGEAGAGKTALLRHFATATSGRVLWGACEPLQTPRPLGPFNDVAEVTGGELAALVGCAARPHEVTAALLDELRAAEPTLLVLEDVHWADEATLDVITLLAPRIASAPALILASYRDDDLNRPEQLRFVLGELVRRPQRLKLDPLSEHAVAQLAAAHSVDAHELFRRTGGNPFYVVEALAAGGDDIPETIRDAVLARAARLSEPAQRLLQAASIVPGQIEPWLLELLARQDAEALDECLASGMLVADRTHVAFRHELARLAIEDALSPPRRTALHRIAVAMLADAGADAARLAHHADHAEDADGVRRWAPRAAERAAATGAHREAAAHYERAIRYAPDLETRAELLQLRAYESYVTADLDAAVLAQEGALACLRALGDELGEGDALRALSRLQFFAGHPADGEAPMLAAVELLEQFPPGHELAMAYANVAQRMMVVERRTEALAWGGKALTLADELGDLEARVYALTTLGALEPENGTLEHALALATEAGLEEHAARIHSTLVSAPLQRRRLALVARHLAAGLEYCDERGLEMWRLYLLASRAGLELARGDWAGAADAAALVLRNPRSPSVARSWALTALGLVRTRRGDAEAGPPLDEAARLARPTGELLRLGPIAAASAERAWLAGDPEGVDAATADVLALALERGVPWCAGELAYWRHQAGIEDGIDPRALAEPYRRAIAGDADGAAALWQELGCPYEAALAAAEGEDLRSAIDALQALGGRPAAAILSRRAREKGVRGVPRGPRARTRENPAGLTARELEVLCLLAEGLRNAQIAERLVVSERTIDHHVSAILSKLDVSTRGEASAEAARRGILSGSTSA